MGAAEGRLTTDKVAYYLSNVRLILQRSPVHLKRASARALALGDHDLAEHFAAKRAEELGHDRWAENDLQHFDKGLKTVPPGEYAPALLGLLHFLEETIERDPATYLAHVLFAEYLITLMGPLWLTLLEERCGIPVRMMSAVSKHVEFDKQHASEGLNAIDRLVTAPSKLVPMRAVLKRVIKYFDEFSAQVMAFEGPCTTTSAT